MAYKAIVTLRSVGDRDLVVIIEESGTGPTAVAKVETTTARGRTLRVPVKGVIRRIKCSLLSEAADQVDPILSSEEEATDTAIELENATPAADIDVVPIRPIPYYAPNGLWHRSRVGRSDGGEVNDTNEVRTVYLVTEGWGD